MSEFNLPDSWTETELSRVADVSSGIGFPLQYQGQSKGEIGFFKVGDISIAVKNNDGILESAQHYVSTDVAQILKGKPIKTGATVFAKIGEAIHLNRRAIVKTDCLVDNNVMSVKAKLDVMDKYVHYFLRTTDFSEQARSTTVPSIRKGDVEELLFPLAPLPEQKRIADKLDTVLARVDACRERLNRVPLILKRFKQSVLAAATSGKLTEDWRLKHKISDEWKHTILAEIADIQGGVTKDSKKQSATDEELPYLRVANVQRGYLDLNEIKYIRIPSSRVNGLLLKGGDILFNEGGDLDKLGRGWIWEGQIDRCSFQNHVFRARLHSESDQPKFVSWWGNSRGLDYFINAGKQTTNLASINKTVLSNLPISMPTPFEQQEIVRRVENLFAFADGFEARLTKARNATESLTPALLAKAFRGELVDQNPNDEPAEVLLKRIQASSPIKEKKISSPRKVMTKLNAELVKAVIQEMQKKSFSFEELRILVPGDYETIKDILFLLMSETSPLIRQMFDEESKKMIFEKVKE